MQNNKQWLEALDRQLQREIHELLNEKNPNEYNHWMPPLQTLSEFAVELLNQALAGEDIQQELQHLQAQWINLSAERSMKMSKIINSAIRNLLVRVLAKVA